MYLISRLDVGEGSRCSDAIRAAGSAFTSPGISILLEVIALGTFFFMDAMVSPVLLLETGQLCIFFLFLRSVLKILQPSPVYRQVPRQVSSYWTWGQGQRGRAILPRRMIELKFSIYISHSAQVWRGIKSQQVLASLPPDIQVHSTSCISWASSHQQDMNWWLFTPQRQRHCMKPSFTFGW